MSRYAQLAEYLEKQGADEVTLSFNEVERILGSHLPASARKLRVWWSNDVTHVQAKYGWLQAGWKVEGVDFDAGAVMFRRVGKRKAVETKAAGRMFEALAAERLSQLYGVKLFRGVQVQIRLKDGGVLKRVFDLASADGRIVGEVMKLNFGKTPAARFPAIAEHVWLLEKVEAEVKFIVLGGDARVPRLWLKKYGALAGNVDFYHISDDGQVRRLN